MSFRVDEQIDEARVVEQVILELDARSRRRRSGDPPLWWPAAEIAQRFEIRKHGSMDSRKRGVRLLMKLVSAHRPDLIASFSGYAFASDDSDLKAYRNFRHRMGLAHLAAESATKRSQVTLDATGQYRFDL